LTGGPFGETLVVDWGLAREVASPEAEAACAQPLALDEKEVLSATEVVDATAPPVRIAADLELLINRRRTIAAVQ
jgi:hypothetical protein